MKTYRAYWTAVVSGIVLLSIAIGCFAIGWVAVVGASTLTAILGAMFAIALIGPDGSWRPVIGSVALWSVAMGAILIGLSPVFGAWTLLVMVVIGATAPPLVAVAEHATRSLRPVHPASDPGRLDDRELARRWRASYDEVHSHRRSFDAVLQLAQERANLLDEMERRNPQGFQQWIDGAAWRSPPPARGEGGRHSSRNDA
jgi:hypothetical protein